MNRKNAMARIRIFSVSFIALFVALLAMTAGICTKAHADPYTRSFVAISGTGPGVLYQPEVPGPKSHIAILVMHPSGNFLEHPAIVGVPPGTGLASRGYTVLALNSTMSSDDVLDYDKLLLQVRNGVIYLKNSVPGVTKVVLLGHSGGGPTMAGYQNIAENGLAACQDSEKIVPCPSSLADMPPADGLLIFDSVLGMGAQTLVTLDPAVANEDAGRLLIPPLDMYNPKNGFHPPTGGTYSSTFIQRFAAHQAKRMAELIHTALRRLARINAGNGKYMDDEPFDIPGGSITNLQIWSLDLNLWARTHAPQQLVHPDGSITTQIVPSLRRPNQATSSPTLNTTGARLTTVRKFLNTWACRTTTHYGYGADYVSGIDWRSTYNNTPGSVEGVTVPLLIVGMSAGSLVVSNETIFNHAASPDKTLVYIEGATHMTYPISGEYGNTTATTVDYVDDWLSTRFLP
jgi:pimeloyl-ACP methyl ester carboxylesterase